MKYEKKMIRSTWSTGFRDGRLHEFSNWPGHGIFVARDVNRRGGAVTKEYNWVGSYEAVQNTIESLDPLKRNFHELITDHTPVKLYFDFEVDGGHTNDYVSEKIRTIINHSVEFLGRSDIQPNDFAVLNSTEIVDGVVKKYSYHIVLTRGVHFQSPQALKEFVFHNFDESYGICMGMYGSNRLLRMPWCTKLGEDRPLVIESSHSFMDCLVTQN
jgi:hypothetical protein